jgi:hypothetical protein
MCRRCGCALIAVVLALLTGTLAAAGGVPEIEVRLIERPPIRPGDYTTLSFSAFNPTPRAVRVTARLELPEGWMAVTAARTHELAFRDSVVIPFTLRSDPQARADRLHPIRLTISTSERPSHSAPERPTHSTSEPSTHSTSERPSHGAPAEESAFSITVAVQVEALPAIALEALPAPVQVQPGGTLEQRFRLTNQGNIPIHPRLELESIPAREGSLSDLPALLEPGQSSLVTAGVRIPESAPSGQPQVLELRVSPVAPGGVAVRRRVAVPVGALTPRIPSYRRMPTELQTYHEHTADGRDLLGLRLNTGGTLWPETDAHLDLHLLSNDRSGTQEGWKRHRLRFDVARRSWAVTLGDLQQRFSNLTLQTLWGRGGRLEYARERYGYGVYGVRDRDSQAQATYAGTAWRRIHPAWCIRGEVSHRRSDVGLWDAQAAADGGGASIPSSDTGRSVAHSTVRSVARSMAAGRLEYQRAALRMHLTGSWSLHTPVDPWVSGRAVEFSADYKRPGLAAQLRSYSGSPHFAGVNRDRDGWFSHLRLSPRLGWVSLNSGHRRPRRPLSIWVSHDAQRGLDPASGTGGQERSRRSRLGCQMSHGRLPALEISAGQERTRQNDDQQDLLREDLQLSAWKTLLRLMVAGHARWSDVRDDRAGVERSLTAWGLSAGGHWRRLQGTLRWNHEEEWLPETRQQRRRQAVGAELTWTAPRGAWQSGLGVSIRQDELSSDQTAVADEILLRPRIEWRLRRGLSLRYEHTLRGGGRPLDTETVRLQLTWASEAGLPIVWQPVRAGIVGLVFIDDNLDGEPDPGETAVANVAVILKGAHLLTNEEGVFKDEELQPGVYWLELNTHSLPPGLVPLQAFPLTLTIEPGRVLELHIPLVRSGVISGVVYRDRDRNGSRSAGEPGMGSVLVELHQAGRSLRNVHTDHAGRFLFRGVAPGSYEVILAPQWLPRSWEHTAGETVVLSLAAGETAEAVTIGIAPESKPIVHTYHAARMAPAPGQGSGTGVGPGAGRDAVLDTGTGVGPGPAAQDLAPAFEPGPSAGPSPGLSPGPSPGSSPQSLLRVACSAVAEGIHDSEPQGVRMTFDADTRVVYFFTQVENPDRPTRIEHVWYFRGEEMCRVPLDVGVPTWRTWSSKCIAAEWTGHWRVEAVDSAGTVLASEEFEYGNLAGITPSTTR